MVREQAGEGLKDSAARQAVIITGGHAGLGFQCARAIAASAWHELVLAGRDLSRVEATAEKLRHDFAAKVAALKLDLASLGSVRSAAADLKQRVENREIAPLHAIVCNAGILMPGAVAYTDDGFERTFATNHLGHFLFVNLLLPVLSTPGRIVVVSSGTHDPETFDGKLVGRANQPDAMRLAYTGNDGGKPIAGLQRYTTSKLCNLLFAYELDRRLRREGRDIAVIGFNPGLVPTTDLARMVNPLAVRLLRSKFGKALLKQLGKTMGDPEFSGASMASLATAPEYQVKSGSYFQSNHLTLQESRSSKVSYDEQLAQKLWKNSERLSGLSP